MPVTVSYPGVYVQEIVGGPPTIGGVATSITAFVGRAYRGPVNQATPIYSFGDYQRYFGGLVDGFPLGFAVNDFFQNGGTQALIVRIYGPSWLTFPVAAEQTSNAGTAAQAVDALVGALTPAQGSTYVTAKQVATAASNAAAQYLNGPHPEQWAAANWLATLAGEWSQALQSPPVTATALATSTLPAVAAQLNGGATAVYNALTSAVTTAVVNAGVTAGLFSQAQAGSSTFVAGINSQVVAASQSGGVSEINGDLATAAETLKTDESALATAQQTLNTAQANSATPASTLESDQAAVNADQGTVQQDVTTLGKDVELSVLDTVIPTAIDATTLFGIAQSTAALQIPGATQQGAQLVVDAMQSVYDETAASSLVLLTTAYQAVQSITASTAALASAAAAAVPPIAASAPSVEALLNLLAQYPGPNPPTNPAPPAVSPDVALAVINPLIAQVMPAPGYALQTFPLTSPITIAKQMVNDNVAAASAAALPATTASVVLQAPQSFVAVANAAHLIAQTAWLATTELNATPASVVQAAQEAATAFKQANPGFANAAAVAAAQAVVNAAQTQIAGPTTPASALAASLTAVGTAAGSAVPGAVQAALNLSSTNSAITSLVAAEAVANAAWSFVGLVAATPAGTKAPAAPSPSLTQVGSAAATDAVSANVAQLVAGQAGSAPTLATTVTASQALVATVVNALPALTLNAANPGEWPNGNLSVTLNTNGITALSVAAMNLVPAPGNVPFAPGDLFNLSVSYTAPDGSTLSENWSSVSLRPDAGVLRIDRVLSNSVLIQYQWPNYTPGSTYPATTPSLVPVAGASGVAGVPTVPVAAPSLSTSTTLSATTVAAQFNLTDQAAAAAAQLQGTPSQPLQLEDYLQEQATHTGIYSLDLVDQFDLMCIPPDIQITAIPPAIPPLDPSDQWRLELYNTAAVYCQSKYAMLILDPPSFWAPEVHAGNTAGISIDDLGTYGPEGEYAAVYFPYLVEGNPTQNGNLGYFAPSGAMAGIMARTDAARGVWKAPAGVNDGAISGTFGLELKLSDTDSGLLNPQGINCLRTFPVYGNVVWGARTLKGADVLGSPYKYVPVRRLALFIEASLLRGMQWAVFEPNAEPLWAAIRLSVGSFMNTLFRQGAFAGTTAGSAYFVACDATTTTATDIAQGIVNVTVGFAPLLPAEFVVITIQQMAGQTPA